MTEDDQVLLNAPNITRDGSSSKEKTAEEAWEAAGDHGQSVLSKLDSSVALRRMTVCATSCSTSSANTLHCGAVSDSNGCAYWRACAAPAKGTLRATAMKQLNALLTYSCFWSADVSCTTR